MAVFSNDGRRYHSHLLTNHARVIDRRISVSGSTARSRILENRVLPTCSAVGLADARFARTGGIVIVAIRMSEIAWTNSLGGLDIFIRLDGLGMYREIGEANTDEAGNRGKHREL